MRRQPSGSNPRSVTLQLGYGATASTTDSDSVDYSSILYTPAKQQEVDMEIDKPYADQTLVEKLRNRAKIRRQIPGRKSVQEGKADRLADLLEEAADEIERLQNNARLV